MAGYTLVVNPGSSSRKYALYERGVLRARLHFEWQDERIICAGHVNGNVVPLEHAVHDLDEASVAVLQLFGQILPGIAITLRAIALRVVAPGSYFLQHRIIDHDYERQLREALDRAPLHVHATLRELDALRAIIPNVPVVGASDSAFHSTKPSEAWNYGIRLDDADQYDIKRFGYHGLSVSSAVHTLRTAAKLPPRVIVCHLGGGASVTAVHHGKSIDTTMGYSPLEGLVMATRAGSIDAAALTDLQRLKGLDATAMRHYLNESSGLLGLSGSSADIRTLLAQEAAGDARSALALSTYVLNVQKAVGQMTAALGGLDAIVFTGTVGERSAPMRKRIMHGLSFLDCSLDLKVNATTVAPEAVTVISRLAHSRPVFVVPAAEESAMERAATATLDAA